MDYFGFANSDLLELNPRAVTVITDDRSEHDVCSLKLMWLFMQRQLMWF
jgi:hypothetical protein